MAAITKDLATKSAKIRALSAAAYKRQETADFLDIRYQHVRNVPFQPMAPVSRSRNPSTPSP